jgi:ubiquinone/menaquinone biosynthesis C-methylase UbiE
MDGAEEIRRYVQTCREEFWQKVFRREGAYLATHLEGLKDILSVGCGPAIIEGELLERGFQVTGLDVSAEALACAPDALRGVVGRAEQMPFDDASFDAVIFVASLQFVEDYRLALARAEAVLRPEGKMIAMLLNTESVFFKAMKLDPQSYMHHIRHTDLKAVENEASRYFELHTEYYLGIRGEDVFESESPEEAALYILRGRKTKRRHEP